MKTKEVYIIAEAGVNHNGSLQNALKLVDAAADAGVDAFKIQTFVPEMVMSKHAAKAGYQQETTGSAGTQLDMVRKLYLDEDAHKRIMKQCHKRKVEFLSSPFDLESIETLERLGLHVIKIPSGEITNMPYLEKIGKLNKKLIVSTGMSTMDEIRAAVDLLTLSGTVRENISVLHCNTAYPTPMEDVNLLAMASMREQLKLEVGYSDHTLGIEVSIAAVALGAHIIEKHFTLDKNMPGPDHRASLEPFELKAMVDAIRNIEKALGDGVKRPSISEKKNIKVARKSLHIARDLKKGHVLTKDDVLVKRPGDGIPSSSIAMVIGKKIKVDLEADHQLSLSDLQNE